MEEYDYDSLRSDLIDHFGTLAQIYPAAYLKVSEVESASDYKLLQIATEEGFNINDYKIYSRGLF